MSTVNTIVETYDVIGMTCDHCARSVRKEISRIDGVEDVAVDLVTGAVTVTGAAGIDPAAVEAAIDEAGYSLAR